MRVEPSGCHPRITRRSSERPSCFFFTVFFGIRFSVFATLHHRASLSLGRSAKGHLLPCEAPQEPPPPVAGTSWLLLDDLAIDRGEDVGGRLDAFDHHDLVSLEDLATRYMLTGARIRHIITRAGYPIRGRGDLHRRITQQLLDLGLTSRDVKAWAIEAGLIDKMSRGTIAPAVLTAYVAAHQPDTTKELSS